jgi:hypothetical protein
MCPHALGYVSTYMCACTHGYVAMCMHVHVTIYPWALYPHARVSMCICQESAQNLLDPSFPRPCPTTEMTNCSGRDVEQRVDRGPMQMVLTPYDLFS